MRTAQWQLVSEHKEFRRILESMFNYFSSVNNLPYDLCLFDSARILSFTTTRESEWVIYATTHVTC